MVAIEWVKALVNAGGTGVIVSLVLGLEAYLRERRGASENATIQQYLDWLRRQEHKELLQGQKELLDHLEENDEANAVLLFHMERILETVAKNSDALSQIRQEVNRLPNMEQKLDRILSQLPGKAPNQVLIDAKVLDVLMSGLVGAGLRVSLNDDPGLHDQGCLLIVWRLGSKSPHLMLADLVGGLRENRLSLILNPDSSISLRAYDGAGNDYEITSLPEGDSEYVIGVANWSGRQLHLWVNGRCDGTVEMRFPFHCLGPTALFGIDIDGKLSADAVRPSIGAMKMGMFFPLDYNGFDLQKDGTWHGARFDIQVVLSVPLDANEIRKVTSEPFSILMRSHSHDDSIAQTTAAIQTQPDDATLYIDRGILFTWRDAYTEAITDFDNAAQIAPDMVEPYFFRGVVKNIIGDLEDAIVDYRRALIRSQRNADIHCRLAWLFATSSNASFRCPTDAIDHALEAFKLCSWRPEIIDTLAAAYAAIDDYPKAIDHQQEALARCPGEFKGSYSRRLDLYRERVPFHDESWACLQELWRYAQKLV